MSNPVLNAIKIQSKVVIPMVRELEKEIGEEHTHAVVGRAIAYVDYCKRRGYEADSHPRVEQKGDDGFPVEREVVDETDETYSYNVAGCQFAEYFRSICGPEIGALMPCGVYFMVEELVRPEGKFERTQTWSKGAVHCDFQLRKGTQSE